MKLLADANVEQIIIARLREDGHDILALSEIAPRAEDPDVLRRAVKEHRVLLTNDKDFAELTFLRREAPSGIVLVRLPKYRTWAKAERVRAVLRSRVAFDGHLTVIQPSAVRRRAFPAR